MAVAVRPNLPVAIYTENRRTQVANPLMNEVLGWLNQTFDWATIVPGQSAQFPTLMNKIDEFLSEKVPEWLQLIEDTIKNTISWGLQRLHELKQVIIKTCRENEPALRSMIELGVKSGIKHGIQKAVLKSVAKTTVTTIKSAATSIGVVADFAQAGLEIAGYREAGRYVGASGNVVSGVAVGFAVGGPVGAGIGAAAGYGVWFAGELTDWLTS